MAGAAQAGLASGESAPCPLLSLDSMAHRKGSDEYRTVQVGLSAISASE